MLSDLLEEQKESVLNLWIESIFNAYPPDSSQFLKNVKDPFRNPVGQTFRRSFDVLYDCLVVGKQNNQLYAALEQAIRIRAVQDCKASQAVAFIFLLKNSVRKVLTKTGGDYADSELVEFEARVDGLALEAFDCYMAAKEKIFEIQAQETKRRTYKLLERIDGVRAGNIYSKMKPGGGKKANVRGSG